MAVLLQDQQLGQCHTTHMPCAVKDVQDEGDLVVREEAICFKDNLFCLIPPHHFVCAVFRELGYPLRCSLNHTRILQETHARRDKHSAWDHFTSPNNQSSL